MFNPKFVRVTDNRFFYSDDNVEYEIPAQSIHAYWKTPNAEYNKPEDYFKTGQDRSKDLVSLFDRFCSKEDKIMELGCNIGRNLHYLCEAGYKNLSGIDINQHSIDLSKTYYPDTVAKMPLKCTSIEDHFITMDNNEVDTMFTLGVLMHIHPSSIWIFRYMAELINKHIIIGEEEGSFNTRVFPRDYKKIFEGVGLKQVHGELKKYPNTVDECGEITVMWRVFKK